MGASRSPLNWASLVLVLAFLCCSTLPPSALGVSVRATKYPLCPLTGKPPVRTVGTTRCADATEYTCCRKCTDVRQALGLVSANFSNFIQWAGLLPFMMTNVNSWINGTDASMCTLFSKKDVEGTGEDGQGCEDFLEQMMCAMSCHPSSGSFVQRQSDGTYVLYLCKFAFTDLAHKCQQVSLPGLVGKVGMATGTNLQIAQDMGNVAWGLGGLPGFQVIVSNLTGPSDDGSLSCWAGPVAYLGPTACCSPLYLQGCPSNALQGDLRKRRYLRRFAGNNNASLSCRVEKEFQTGKNITLFSPPLPSPPSSPSPPPANRTKGPPPPSPPSSPSLPPANRTKGPGTAIITLPTDTSDMPPPSGRAPYQLNAGTGVVICALLLGLLLA